MTQQLRRFEYNWSEYIVYPFLQLIEAEGRIYA